MKTTKEEAQILINLRIRSTKDDQDKNSTMVLHPLQNMHETESLYRYFKKNDKLPNSSTQLDAAKRISPCLQP